MFAYSVFKEPILCKFHCGSDVSDVSRLSAHTHTHTQTRNCLPIVTFCHIKTAKILISLSFCRCGTAEINLANSFSAEWQRRCCSLSQTHSVMQLKYLVHVYIDMLQQWGLIQSSHLKPQYHSPPWQTAVNLIRISDIDPRLSDVYTVSIWCRLATKKK